MKIEIDIPIEAQDFKKLSDVYKFGLICRYADVRYKLIEKASSIQLFFKDGSSCGAGWLNMALIGENKIEFKEIKDNQESDI